MPRIPYCDPSTLSAEARAHLGDSPVNVSRMMAGASEPVYQVISEIGGAFINGSELPPRLRELAILRVGYLSNSPYELFQHEALGRHIGMSDEEIAAIRAGDSGAAVFGEMEAAALSFVDDLVRNVRASDATLSAVRRHLTDRQVVDLILVTGAYMMVCRFLETTGVELDDKPIDWNAIAKAR